MYESWNEGEEESQKKNSLCLIIELLCYASAETLESKSEDFLEYIQVERQRNDSVESELINFKCPKGTTSNQEEHRIDKLDDHQASFGKELDEISNQVQNNVNELTSVTQLLGTSSNNLGDVEERLNQNVDKIKHIDDTFNDLQSLMNLWWIFDKSWMIIWWIFDELQSLKTNMWKQL